MLVLKEFLFQMIMACLRGYELILFAYCIIGFFITNRYAPWFVFLQEMVEPPLRWIRQITKNRLVIESIDLSPLLLFFGIELLRYLLYALFY